MPKPIDQTAQPFLTRIENLHNDLESERGSYMQRCKALRDDIKEVYGEAKNAGITVKALKGLVRWRKLARDQEKIADGLDTDESAEYARLVETLGPLGAAAARQAGYSGDDGEGGDDRDVRPRFALNDDAPRADEEHLARVGRGRAAH